MVYPLVPHRVPLPITPGTTTPCTTTAGSWTAGHPLVSRSAPSSPGSFWFQHIFNLTRPLWPSGWFMTKHGIINKTRNLVILRVAKYKRIISNFTEFLSFSENHGKVMNLSIFLRICCTFKIRCDSFGVLTVFSGNKHHFSVVSLFFRK